MKNIACSLVMCAALALLPACDNDPVQPNTSSGYLRLTSRDAVLNNIEVAWNQRATYRIDDLLDKDFMFFFAPGDVGGEIPVQWLRADELAATGYLFVSNREPVPEGPVCTEIHVDLDLDEVVWQPIVPQPNSLGETWYTATVYYNLTFKMEPDQTYISESGAKAQFTVGEVAVGSGTEWRLVQLRDLGNSLVAGATQTARSEEKTWGSIKALYH